MVVVKTIVASYSVPIYIQRSDWLTGHAWMKRERNSDTDLSLYISVADDGILYY